MDCMQFVCVQFRCSMQKLVVIIQEHSLCADNAANILLYAFSANERKMNGRGQFHVHLHEQLFHANINNSFWQTNDSVFLAIGRECPKM